MRDTDHDAFVELLDGVCGLLSRGAYCPSATNTALWFRSLAGHDLATVRAAFDAHIRDPQRGRFVPVPADIIAQLQGAAADDGRPGAEEAWSMALAARDESATVVWTDETRQAWFAAAPVLELGDKVGARMAFRETYERITADARRQREPVRWDASLGFDAHARAQAIADAVDAGRLPREALLALPSPTLDSSSMPLEVRETLAALRADIMASDEPISGDFLGKALTKRAKESAQVAVDAYRDATREEGRK